MKNIISLNDFKNSKITLNQDTTLTKAGESFRKRFTNALLELENKLDGEINKAKSVSEIKTKINISTTLKQAKSSPLAAYSTLHKEFVEKEVNEALKRCNEKLEIKFKDKKKPTIERLQKQLAEERSLFKAELSKLASQKMTEYLEIKEKNN